MTLFDLVAKITLDKSEYESGLGDAERSIASFASGMGTKIGVISGLTTAAINAIGNTVRAGTSAVSSLISQSVNAYGEYEQLAGGVETVFKGSSDRIIEYAKNAFKTAGISANEYLQTATSFAASLINSLTRSSEATAQMSAEEVTARKQSLDDQYDAQKDAYDRQYKQLQESLNDQYDLKKKAFRESYEQLKESLDAEYDAIKESYDKRYREQKEAYDDEYDAAKDAASKRIDAVKDAQDAEVEACRAATDARIAMINEEYTESLKLIDKEEYDRIKAIDAQIDALKDEEKQEQRARDKREQDERIENLKDKVASAKTVEDKLAAERALNNYRAQIEDKARKDRRDAAIDDLKKQKDQIREQANQQKQALKESKDRAVAAAREQGEAQLNEIKRSNEAQIRQIKESSDAELKTMRKGQESQLRQLKETQDVDLKQRREANEQKLKDLDESQETELSKLKKSQDKQLDALKDSNDKKLKEFKRYVDAQKKILDQSSKQQESYQQADSKTYQDAAELTDMAIKDMADNVNKMGSSMEAVQNAYRGFSRGNFTMLDNLNLGFAGTKEGMQQLLDKAKEISGIDYDINSYADIIKAIHVVQEQMGITGTTAKEASGTIQGSISAFKSSLKNLVAGFADPKANLGKLIDDVIGTGKTALKNLIPAFKNVLKGIAQALKEIAPIISKELPGIIKDVLPPLMDALGSLAVAVAQNLPQIISVILDALPGIIEQIVAALKEGWPKIRDAIMGFLDTTEGKIVAAVLGVIAAIKGIGILTMLGNFVGLLSSGPIGAIIALVAGVAAIVIANWDKIKEAWGVAVEWFGNVWQGIKQKFSDVKEWFTNKFRSAKESVVNTWNNIGEKFRSIRDSISDKFSNIKTWLTDKFTGAREGVLNAWSNVTERFGKIRDGIANFFKSLPESFKNIGQGIMIGLWNGIVEKVQTVYDKFKEIGGNILSMVRGIFKENSPSKVFKEIGGYLMEGMAIGVDDKSGMVERAMKDMSQMVYDNVPNPDIAFSSNARMAGMGRMMSVPRQETPKMMTVILELDRMQLARAVYQLNNQETQRVGVRLAGGYA